MSRQPKKKNASRQRHTNAVTLSRVRVYSLVLVLVSLPLALIWHLAHLQVVSSNERGFAFLQEQGQSRTVRQERINAYRGVITDRNGEILAVSTPVISLYANPQRLDMTRLDELAQALNMSSGALLQRVSLYADKQFVYLARQLPPQEANKVLALNIAGVGSEEEFQRYYPAGEVAAHIVGFTDIDERGQEGMELALDDFLGGAPGVRKVVKDLKGNVVKDLGILTAASSGNDVKLTIDLRLQYLAHRELKTAIAEQNAASGSVVVMDAHSGEVLAMANQPSYNPNNRRNLQPDHLRNRALVDLFEPGSTMKPFTVITAFETGRYHPGTVINTNPGHYRIAGKTYQDIRNYGELDLTGVMQKSSQVGIIKLALDLEPDAVRDMFFRVGFGQGTGIGFPGEAIGVLPNRTRWHPTERASMAFGYGMNATALQLAQGYSAIAAGGIRRPSSLLMQRKVPDGTRVFSPQDAQKMMNILKMVTQDGGTGTRARMDAYLAAGKSGTSRKVAEHGGYAEDKYVALFAGMAPADNPQIVVVVVIDEPPPNRYYGGEAAAPVFSKVMESTLRMLHVPPSNHQLVERS